MALRIIARVPLQFFTTSTKADFVCVENSRDKVEARMPLAHSKSLEQFNALTQTCLDNNLSLTSTWQYIFVSRKYLRLNKLTKIDDLN